MTAQSDDATLAVVVARLDDLREQQRRDTETLTEAIEVLRRELATSRGDMVSRGEWVQRNSAVDARFQEMGREVAGLRTQHATDVATLRTEHDTDTAMQTAKLDGQHAPWWSSWAIALSAAAVAWSIFGPIITNRP